MAHEVEKTQCSKANKHMQSTHNNRKQPSYVHFTGLISDCGGRSENVR